MENNIILAKAFINANDQPVINRCKPSIIVCNDCQINGLDKHVQILRTDAFRVEGSWETYRFNTKTTLSLKSKRSRLFKCLGFDISPAIAKLTYWSNYKVGAVKACLKQFDNKNYNILDLSDFTSASKPKSILKCIFLQASSLLSAFGKSKKQKELKFSPAEIGILIKEDLEFALYASLIEKLKAHKVIVFHYGNISKELFSKLDAGIQTIDLSAIITKPQLPLFNPFFLDKHQLHVAKTIASSWPELTNEISRYQMILRTGIKCLLINEGENLPYRNLLKVVFGSQVRVFNTMNGIKAGEAQDADVNFDAWFVWDEGMKELLANRCKLPESMLLNVGHLARDFKSSHRFENRLGLDLLLLKSKIVITIFSVRGKRNEKTDVEELLLNLLKSRDDIYIVYKPHPLEVNEDFLFNEVNTDAVYIVPDTFKNSKDVLYELISLSDVSIVFGSTVALESSWFETPCLTVEYRNQSIVYATDGKDILHIYDKNGLQSELSYLKKKKSEAFETNSQSVSDKIARYLVESVLPKNTYI